MPRTDPMVRLLEGFEKAVLEALKKLPIEELSETPEMHNWAKNLLRNEKERILVERSVETPDPHRNWFHSKEHKLERLQEHRNMLFRDVLRDGAEIFAEGLVAHLNSKQKPSPKED